MKIKSNKNVNLKTKKQRLRNKKDFNIKINDIQQSEDDLIESKLNIYKNRKNTEIKTQIDDQNEQESFVAGSTSKNKIELNLKNKKPKKKRMLYTPNKHHEKSDEEEETGINSNEDRSHQVNLLKHKKKRLDTTNEEYKPGMLSDSIQIRKYGRVIIPWDPSFGLDKTYTIPIQDSKDFPKLKINPLFDLSKRIGIASKPVGEKTQRTIFVGNLPGDSQISDIKKLFKKCGLIHKIKIKDRKMKSFKEGTADKSRHKNAFITFKKEDSCDKALKFNGHLFKNCHLRVNKAQDTSKPETRISVFVGNLAFKTQDEDLWKAFESCGEIEDVRIIRDQATGIGKGYGYVNFKSEEAIEKAIELDGLSILDRNIRVRRNEIGTVERPEKFVKRKRGKKKKRAILPDNTDEESNQNNFQESNCEMTKFDIEPKQKKVKKDKSKQFMKKPKTLKKSSNK